MTKREQYEEKVTSYLMPVIEKLDFELVDVEYVREAGTWYLRAYIDKEGGIAIDDCAVVSRNLGEWLDENDFIEDSYILEVSSPGLGRPLKKDKDFERSIGKDVDIKLYKAINKQKDFTGTLLSWDKESVSIGTDKEELNFKRTEIALIRLAFDF